MRSKNEEKVSKFADILAQLRRERGISQKKASADLGISQALLSHYEKGIRECGLDFVIRCSKYYGVTTDFMLGVSESRNGVSTEYLADFDGNGRSAKSLSDATKYLLETTASASNSPEEKGMLYDYYLLTLYRSALTLAKAGVLPKEMFTIEYSVAKELCSAAIAMQDAKFVLIEDRSRSGLDQNQHIVLQSLIAQAEEHIVSNYLF